MINQKIPTKGAVLPDRPPDRGQTPRTDARSIDTLDIPEGTADEGAHSRGELARAAPASGKLLALTGIRGIAACWVVGFHVGTNLGGALGGFPARNTIVLRSGFLAVDLFFMLSGFVLAYSYLPRLSVHPALALREFAIGRAFRILPLNWAMLILLLALSTALPSRAWSNEPLTAPSFWASMALVQAWGLSSATSWNFPAWSLSAEWAAYVLFPVVLLMIKCGNSAGLALAAGLACLAVLCVVMTAIGGGTLEHSWLLGLPRCFLQFFAGACLWRAFDLGLFRGCHPDAVLLVGLASLALVMTLPRAELLAPFAFGATILGCAMRSSLATRLFANRTSVFLGEISFSIYLSHAIILSGSALLAASLGIASQSLMIRTMFLILTCAAILAVSYLSWQAIERPGQAAGREWQRRLERRAAASQPGG